MSIKSLASATSDPASAAAELSPHRSTFLPHPSPEAVAKFKVLYLQEYGVDLDSQAALQLATTAMQFVFLRITPCPVQTVSSTPAPKVP